MPCSNIDLESWELLGGGLAPSEWIPRLAASAVHSDPELGPLFHLAGEESMEHHAEMFAELCSQVVETCSSPASTRHAVAHHSVKCAPENDCAARVAKRSDDVLVRLTTIQDEDLPPVGTFHMVKVQATDF